MNTTPFRLIAVLAGLMLGPAAVAQTVTLPSTQVFRYSGSVLVPDRGTAHLGGSSAAASGRSRRGWRPAQQSFGSNDDTSGLSVRATIIDHQEIDRQLLGGTPEAFVRSRRATEAARAARDRKASRSRKANSPADDAAVATESGPTPLEEGKKLVRHARRLVQAGELRRAESAYRLAVSMLPEPLKTYAKSEYQSVLHQPPAVDDPFGG